MDEFLKILDTSDHLCKELMTVCLENMEKNLLNILIECPDATSRSGIQVLINFMLKKLLPFEKEYLDEWEQFHSQKKNDKGEEYTATYERPKALSSRLICFGMI